MAANVIVDAGFLVALVRKRDTHRDWAVSVVREHPPPWHICDAALSEAFYLLDTNGGKKLVDLCERRALKPGFCVGDDLPAVLSLMRKYADVPMSLADACLVRMTEILADPLLLTTDTDFRVYRRFGRRTVPCKLPR